MNPFDKLPPGMVLQPTNFVDELTLVDEDVAMLFRGKEYLRGMPVQVQMVREIRKLREVLEKNREDKK